MQLASKAHSYIRPAAGILTAVIAITTTLNVAAAKYAPNAPYTSKVAIITSRIIGPQATGMVFASIFPGGTAGQAGNIPGVGPGWASLPTAGIVPFGPLNLTTFGGIAILVVNYFLKQFHIPYYNSYAAPFVNALGLGTTVGGVIGGLLDPDPSQMGQSGGQPFLSYNPIQPLAPQQTSPAQSSQAQPFLSVARVRLHGR